MIKFIAIIVIKKWSTCAFCSKIVTDNPLLKLNKIWHQNHFVCMVCHKDFKNGNYLERNSLPYCEEHINSTCKSCKQLLNDKVVNALDSLWHFEHFACQICWKPYGRGFYQHHGYPYCEIHIEEVKDK